MKKYQVIYEVYDNSEWRSRSETTIIEANNEEEVRMFIRNKSNFLEEYYASNIFEINGE